MTTFFERIATATLVLCASVTTSLLVRREFADVPAPALAVRKSGYEKRWNEALALGRHSGTAASPIKLVEFSDYQCPFCKQFHSTVAKLQARYPGKIEHVFLDFPLSIHPYARDAAVAAECASRQGMLSEMRDRLFAAQAELSSKPWVRLADSAGVKDLERFTLCLTDTTAFAPVDRTTELAHSLELKATPTVILNGWRYGAPPSDSELIRAVDDILSGRRPYPNFPMAALKTHR